MIDIDDYKVEVSCEYKGETYSVRDNGAIMRHPKKADEQEHWMVNGHLERRMNQWLYVFLLTFVFIKLLLQLLGAKQGGRNGGRP